MRLAQGSIPSVAKRTQVIYTTHAPLFVGLDRFDQIRILRKQDGQPERPKITVVSQATLADVAEDLWNLAGQPQQKFTPKSLRTRMQTLMTPWMNEGFFADVVVLVEGEGDRSAILAVADSMGHDLSAMGVAIVPCMGKPNMDRAALVFKRLEIRSYLIWDNDKRASGSNNDASANRRLLKLVGAQEEDWPAGAWDTHACFDCNLEDMLRLELSEPIFDQILTETSEEYQIKRESALKNSIVLRRVIEEAAAQGHHSETLGKIVEKIAAACGEIVTPA